MNKTISVVLLIAVVYAVSAVPVGQQDNLLDEPSHYEPESYVRADRIARATCDLLSAEVKGVKLNHAACAAHCLVLNKGFKGGSCNNGVCHCRK